MKTGTDGHTLTQIRLEFGATDWEENEHKVHQVNSCEVGTSENLGADGNSLDVKHFPATTAPLILDLLTTGVPLTPPNPKKGQDHLPLKEVGWVLK